MARTGREFAITHRAKLAAQGLLGHGDAEFLELASSVVAHNVDYETWESESFLQPRELNGTPRKRALPWPGRPNRLAESFDSPPPFHI